MSARADRCPPVPLRILYGLPPGSAKLFCIAAAEGKGMNPRGTYDDLMRTERPIGVHVGQVQRKRILDTTKTKPGRWMQMVRQWEQAGLIHRCALKEIFIYLEPARVCPHCARGVTESNAGTSLRVTRGVTESNANSYEPGNPLREGKGGMDMDRALEPKGLEGSKKDLVGVQYVASPSLKEQIAAASAREDFAEVVRIAGRLGWAKVEYHANLAPSDPESRDALARKLAGYLVDPRAGANPGTDDEAARARVKEMLGATEAIP